MNYVTVLIPINRADRRNVVDAAHVICKKTIPYLPSEHGGVLRLVAHDGQHDDGRGDLWLGATDDAWLDGARLVPPREDLAHTPVAHSQLT